MTSPTAKIFYTYLWLREDGTPYYVGKGTGRRAYTNKGHITHRPVKSARIFVQFWASEKESFEMEKWYISLYGRKDLGTGILRNMTDGGVGGISNKGKKHSPEHTRKIAEANTGKKHTDETKLKMSLIKKGKPYPDKLRAALLGRKNPHTVSLAQRESIRIALTGRKHSEETKQKMREAHALRIGAHTI